MRGRRAAQMIDGVEPDDVVIQLELTVAGTSVTGRARRGTAAAREFSGRLGLMAAIDELIGEDLPPSRNGTGAGGAAGDLDGVGPP